MWREDKAFAAVICVFMLCFCYSCNTETKLRIEKEMLQMRLEAEKK